MKGPALLLAALLAACHAPPPPPPFAAAPAQRELSDDERRVWDTAARLARALERGGGLLRDPDLEAYLEAILARLFPEQAGALRPRVLLQPDVNAITLADGSIYLFSGAVARMENEAQLAYVLAHEGTHFTHRHTYAARARSRRPLFESTYGYERDQEREADRVGFERFVAAGYAPREAARALAHLAQVEELHAGERRDSIATHPEGAQRAADLAQRAAGKPDGGRVARGEYQRRTARARAAAVEEALERFDVELALAILDAHRDAGDARGERWRAEAWRRRGGAGDLERAEAALVRSLERAPDDAAAHRALGRLLLKQGRRDAARTHLARALELAPEAPDRGHVEAELALAGGGP